MNEEETNKLKEQKIKETKNLYLERVSHVGIYELYSKFSNLEYLILISI